MLLGQPERVRVGAPRILFIKARLDNHHGETSAPALGILYLGAIARRAGWDVRCIDTYLEADADEAIRQGIAELSPNVIGVSALTSESISMHHFARVARAAAPDAVLLAGGPHPSAYPDETLENTAIDAAVIGEGETTLDELLAAVERGEPWQSLPGTAVRDADGRVRTNVPRVYIEDLDELPMPAWDLTDVDAYSRRRGMSLAGMRRYMPIMTSRGCPYRCTYCHDIQGKRFRSHSPEYVLRLIDELGARLDVHDLDIVDDIFNFDAARMTAICDAIIARKRRIGFTLPNGVRADRMNVEIVDKLSRAGCEYVAIAVETASKRLQKQIRKHVRFDKLVPVIDAFSERNVFTAGFFMVGFPSETEEELRSTIDFALGSTLHAAFFFVVTPFQGTELFGQIQASLDQERTRSFTHLFARQKINLSDVPDDRFFAIRRRAFLRFYLDPVRMLRTLRALPKPGHLAHLAFIMLFRDTLRLEPGRLLGPLARLRSRMQKLPWLADRRKEYVAEVAPLQRPPAPAAARRRVKLRVAA